jgi:ATP-dependent Lon protease
MSDPIEPELIPPSDDAKPAKPAESAKESPKAVARPEDTIPSVILALPLSQRPVFPTMMLPLVIPAGRLADAMRHAVTHMNGYVGFFMTKAPLDDGATYSFADLAEVGCVARITKHNDVDGGALQVFAQVLARFRITAVEQADPVLLVRGEPMKPQVDAQDPQVRSYAMAIVGALKDLVQHNPIFADEIKMVLANFNNIDGPCRLADISASLTTAKREEIQQVLETIDIVPRMERVLALLAQELQLSQLKAKIQTQIEEKVSEHQRKFFLNEQLKAIKQELGLESDDKSLDVKRFKQVLDTKGAHMSAEVKGVFDDELRKLQLLDPASSEYGVVRTRLEWLSDMPWGTYTEDDLDLTRLRTGLDKDHFGLEDVKERIVEFCAVRRLKQDRGGGIIALVGPPGTGKTSVGASIARNLGRKFFRLSLGGMRDEAEIKGHRRTYVGALPGKLVQALKRSQSMNPVILLDEVDKMGISHQGDPAAALLEVLDPEQNRDFLDHYLDVRVDLSQVLFICTANDLGGIPEPLKDRMEIIRLAGYVEAEKQVIARDFLVTKGLAAHGLTRRDLAFTKTALTTLIRDYAREAGVRQLEQLVNKVCRKIATEKARGMDGSTFDVRRSTLDDARDSMPIPGSGERRTSKREASPPGDVEARSLPAEGRRTQIGPADLVKYLGKPLMRDDALLAHPVPGVVTGLAWTAMGGATLEVEAVAVASEKGGLVLTGQLGEVMKESANLARSYLMANAAMLGVTDTWFDKHTVHLHVPAGATPKDGPSAGCTIATALLSLATGTAVRRKLGMTGELTLTGRIYPIGGVREKLVAAKRSGLERVLLPKANERDYDELPAFLKTGITVVFTETLADVLREAGLADNPKRRVRRSTFDVRRSTLLSFHI